MKTLNSWDGVLSSHLWRIENPKNVDYCAADIDYGYRRVFLFQIIVSNVNRWLEDAYSFFLLIVQYPKMFLSCIGISLVTTITGLTTGVGPSFLVEKKGTSTRKGFLVEVHSHLVKWWLNEYDVSFHMRQHTPDGEEGSYLHCLSLVVWSSFARRLVLSIANCLAYEGSKTKTSWHLQLPCWWHQSCSCSASWITLC